MGAALIKDHSPGEIRTPGGEPLCNEPPKDPPPGLKNYFLLQQYKLPALSFCLQTMLQCSRDYFSFK